MSTSFLYHLCAADFRGTELYPLKRLAEVHPDLYERERAKFVGREPVLTYRLPILDVAWADTVNLSTLDPRKLVAARRGLGVPFSRLLERRLARIPVERIGDLPAVRYASTTHWINSLPGVAASLEPPVSDFTRFDAASHVEEPKVPVAHLEYLVQQRDRCALALGFVFVPHVLVASPIDLAGLELLDL